MSIFTRRERLTSHAQRPTSNCRAFLQNAVRPSLHDLEGSALAVARSRAGKKRADCVNGLAVAADDSANVALAQLHFKDRHFTARNFREHHLVRVLDELADDKLEKFPHADLKI